LRLLQGKLRPLEGRGDLTGIVQGQGFFDQAANRRVHPFTCIENGFDDLVAVFELAVVGVATQL